MWALRATAAEDVVLGVSYLPGWLSYTHLLSTLNLTPPLFCLVFI